MDGFARVIITGDNRPLKPALRSAEKDVERWAQGIRSRIKGAFSGAWSQAVNITGFAGAFGIAALSKYVLEFEDRLDQLGTASGRSRAEMRALGADIKRLADETGIADTKILAGAETFQALTGEFETNIAVIDDFARASRASSADLESLAKIGAAVKQNLGVQSSDFQRGVFGVLIEQGKQGKIELKDMASEFASLTARFQSFKNKGTAGVAELGGLFQVAARGFGTAAEAATGLEALMNAVELRAKQLKKAGINVLDKEGNRRAISDIAFELVALEKKKPFSLNKILGRSEAIATVKAIGIAGRAEFERMRGAGGGRDIVAEDLARRMESPAVKVAQSIEKVKHAFGDVLVRNLPTLIKLIEGLGKALEIVAKNPLAFIMALGAIKGGGLAGDLANAMIGGGGLAGTGAGGGGPGSGMYGPMTRAQDRAMGRSRMLATGGRMLGRAGIGLAIAGALDLDPVQQAATAARHALGGLPGPLGAVATGVNVLVDLCLLKSKEAAEAADAMNARTLARNYSIPSALEIAQKLGVDYTPQKTFQWGSTEVTRAESLGTSVGAIDPTAVVSMVRILRDIGALRIEGKGGASKFSVDKDTVSRNLKGETPEQTKALQLAAQRAQEFLSGLADSDFKQHLYEVITGETSSAGLADKVASAVAAGASRIPPQKLEIKVTADRGLKVDWNAPTPASGPVDWQSELRRRPQ